MPQIFQVLRCYKCLVFQIHQTKKSNKWECKMCGEKQSIKRHYGIGTGKDCRLHVQKLNKMQAEQTNMPNMNSESETDEEECKEDLENIADDIKTKHNSKWSNYVNEPKEETETDQPMYINDQEVVLEMPKKIRRTKVKSKNKKLNLETGDHNEDYNNFCTSKSTKEVSIDGETKHNFTKRKMPIKTAKLETNIQTPVTNCKRMNFVEKKQLSQKKADNAKIKEDNCTVTPLSDNYHNYNNFPINSLDQDKQDFKNSVKSFVRIEEYSIRKVNNSKWTHFVENEESLDPVNMSSDIEDLNSDRSQYTSMAAGDFSQENHNTHNIDLRQSNKYKNETIRSKKGPSLFSMVEEHDLDSILDI